MNLGKTADGWTTTCASTLLAAIMLSGCGTFGEAFKRTESRTTAESIGEIESGYTYIPIDPFPVDIQQEKSCPKATGNGLSQLLASLPDNAVRMLVERFDKQGNVTYGASKSGLKDESYRVTVDYINADTINVPVIIEKSMRRAKDNEYDIVSLFAGNLKDFIAGTERYRVTRIQNYATSKASLPPELLFNIPVYVGVGLRVSSFVFVTGASANISGIGVIGAEAEAERVKGSLVVQTLGVNGKSVAAALPIQSELNRTTAQNAIVAVGSIKALLYAEETVKSPRVVGMYLPFPGGKPLVNALISELSKQPVEWQAPCLSAQTATASKAP
jgi:hypothetical protein